jgi:hypothetical protein
MRRGARLLGVVLAVVVCAWFVVGIRQAQDTSQAQGILSGRTPLSAAQKANVASLLSQDGWLNPDSEVDLLRARLDVDQGRFAAARRLVERVLADEPRNAGAWVALAQSSGGEETTFYTALIRLRELIPRVPLPR